MSEQFKYNPITGKLDLVEALSSATLQTPGIPWVNASTQLQTDITNMFWDDDLKSINVKNISVLAGVSTTHLYVSTTGSDSNDGLTALTPFLTIQKAIDTLPLVMSGVFQINLAAGTYVQTAVIQLGNAIAKSASSEVSCLVNIVGAARTTTFIQGVNSTTNIFNTSQKTVAWSFDKLTFTGGARNISMENGLVQIADCDFTNYNQNGIACSNFSQLLFVAGTGTKTFTPLSTSSTTSGIVIGAFSVVTQATDLVFASVRGSGSSAINVGTFGSFNRTGSIGVGNITITTDATSPPRFGIFVNTNGSFFGGGGTGSTIAMTGPLTTSTAGYGGFRMSTNSRANFVLGQAFSFTNISKAISLDMGALWTSSADTYSFTTVTTPVELAHGCIASSGSAFSLAAITYVDTATFQNSGLAKFGYDDRYALIAAINAIPATAIPYANSSKELIGDITNAYFTTATKTATFGNVDAIANASTTNLYVATTGSDSNDGLTVGTPFLTIQKAIDSLPLVMGGIFQINLAAGTYSSGAAISCQLRVAKRGDANAAAVVKIVGAAKATTIVAQSSAALNIFEISGSSVIYDFDEITFSGGLRQLLVTNGLIYVRNCDFVDFTSSGVRCTNWSIVNLGESGDTVNFTPLSTATAIGAITAQVFSAINTRSNVVFNAVKGSASSAISVGNNSRIVRVSGDWTITTDSGTPPRNPIFISTYGSLIVGGTVNITGPISTASGGHGAIRVLTFGYLQTGATTTFNITNCAKGFSFQPNTIFQESGAATFTFTTVTTPVELSYATICHSDFGGAAITYSGSSTSSTEGTGVYGYDKRYSFLLRPNMSRSTVSDADFTFTVGTDAFIGYTFISASRAVTLPTIADATAGIPTDRMVYYIVKDESGSCSRTNTLTVGVSGGANIEGVASDVLNEEFAERIYYTYVGASQYFKLTQQINDVSGTATNDNAALGIVGEYVSANSAGVTVGASGAFVNIASISLTAGDWDVDANVRLDTSVITATDSVMSISLTSAAQDSTNNGGIVSDNVVLATGTKYSATGTRRISLAATTTVYLVGAVTYTVAGTDAYHADSIIRARRVR